MYEREDRESQNIVQGWTGKLNLVSVQLPNMERMTSTMNAGIARAKGDVVAFLDEDVLPGRAWLEKLMAEFEDREVAACGGKDTVMVKGRQAFQDAVDEVGILKWKGCVVGNQHRGATRRDVTFLKGCNMAVRRALLEKLDENLLGLVRWEQDIFFNILREHKRVIYDPGIEVHHRKERLEFLSPWQTFCYGHNTLYLLLKHSRGKDRLLAFLFALLVGNGSSPGITKFPLWVGSRGDMAMCSFATAQIGKMKAISSFSAIGKRKRSTARIDDCT